MEAILHDRCNRFLVRLTLGSPVRGVGHVFLVIGNVFLVYRLVAFVIWTVLSIVYFVG